MLIPFIPLSLSFLIVLFHVLGEGFSERLERFHRYFLSLGAGSMVGALFLEILPQISAGQAILNGTIYLVFLAGFVFVHFLEKFVYVRTLDENKSADYKTQFEDFGLLAYQLLSGVVIAVFFENYGNAASLILVPLFIRSFALSISTRHIAEKKRGNLNHLLRLLSPLIGTGLGLVFIQTSYQAFLVFAATSGAILYITVRDVIPASREGKPAYFLIGAVIAVVAYLILGIK